MTYIPIVPREDAIRRDASVDWGRTEMGFLCILYYIYIFIDFEFHFLDSILYLNWAMFVSRVWLETINIVVQLAF